MRKHLLALIVMALAIVSCNKTETIKPDNQSGIVSDLPATITTYVAEYYPDATIASALKSSDASYLVTLSTSELLTFDNNGNHVDQGVYHYDQGHADGDHGCGGFPVDSLPASITDYIAANYDGYTIRHASLDTLCQFGAVTEVILSMDSLGHVKLIFDETDAFVAQADRMLYADIPAIVTEGIAAAYPDYTARSMAELFTLVDNSLQYKVFLHLDSIHLSVVMAEDGSVICESPEEAHGGGHHGGGDHGGGGHHGGGGDHGGGGGDHGGGGHHGGGDHHGGIPVDSLSATITDYIALNYAGYTIRFAKAETCCQFGDVTEVTIAMDGVLPVELIFGEADAFVATEGHMPYADVPAEIAAAVANAYAGYTASNKAELFTLADGSLQYKVYLEMDHTHLAVVFDAAANVECEN